MKRPVDAQWPESQRFGEDPATYAPLGYAGHQGLDFAVPVGTPVVAAEDGTVYIAIQYADPTAGMYVHLKHADGLQTRYLHFSRVDVAPGETVTAGQQIGLSGNTGMSTGPHLHFEVIDPTQPNNGYKGRVDPEPYLQQGVTMTDADKAIISDAVAFIDVNVQERMPEVHAAMEQSNTLVEQADGFLADALPGDPQVVAKIHDLLTQAIGSMDTADQKLTTAHDELAEKNNALRALTGGA